MRHRGAASGVKLNPNLPQDSGIETKKTKKHNRMTEMTYSLNLPYTEFQEYMCEDIMTGFDTCVEDDGSICIEYKYGSYSNGVSTIIFWIPDTDSVHRVRYTGSSPFAMWWCGMTDNNEDDEDVDDVDAPNIYPYKKCSDCGERKSCGNYNMDKEWFCEDCECEEQTSSCYGCFKIYTESKEDSGYCSQKCHDDTFQRLKDQEC